MYERRLGHLVSGHELLGDEVMVKSEEIEPMLEMQAHGLGAKRIAAELGCARNTVRRYLERAIVGRSTRPIRRRLAESTTNLIAPACVGGAGRLHDERSWDIIEI